MYWLSPKRHFTTGFPLEYVYSAQGCRPGYAQLARNGYSIIVPIKGLLDYKKGAMVQDAFPELSDTDREFLITGLSPEEQRLVFTEEE
jgi:hypothetical protein